MKRTWTVSVLVLLVHMGLLVLPCMAAVGTSFTYQGRIKDGSSWANGEYDLQFMLFDASTGGNQLGSTGSLENIQIADGFFSEALDFGAVFTGDPRWLQTGVRPGSSTGDYTTLTPRQELKPVPYAMFAANGGESGSYPSIHEVDGKVGIGKTTPETTLHIVGATGTPEVVRVENSSSTHTRINLLNAQDTPTVRSLFTGSRARGTPVSPTDCSAGDEIVSFMGYAYIDGSYRANASIDAWVGSTPGAGSYPSYITFFTTANGATSRSERVRITESGNVGIGTASPGQLLETFGLFPQIKVTANPSVSSAAGIKLQPSTGNGNDGNPWILYVGDGGTPNTFFVNYNGSQLVSVKSNGNVGIGTTSPQGKLDVNGSIYQRGSSLHADYVFESSYPLESIEEHAEFMWANRHLKAVPKATRDEEGREVVEVGGHQKGIVEELEKAHIYIEQLHKENEDLKKRLERLEKMMSQGVTQ